MAKSGSGKKNVTGVGVALEAFLKAHKITVSALARALHELEPDSDPETFRRTIQRWLKGTSLRGTSVSKLEEAFQKLGVAESFQGFLSSNSPPPLPHPLPPTFEDWVWLALHDYTYVQGHGLGWTDWDEEADGPVTYKPPAMELKAQAQKQALKVWTFFKRVNYRWERDDYLDRIYRRIYRRVLDELLYRYAFLLQHIEMESYENASLLAGWLACKRLVEVAADPDWTEPPSPYFERVSHDEVLNRAEFEGPLCDGFFMGHGWPGRWIDPGEDPWGLYQDERSEIRP